MAKKKEKETPKKAAAKRLKLHEKAVKKVKKQTTKKAVKKPEKTILKKKKFAIDMAEIKAAIKKGMHSGEIEKGQAQIIEQRAPVSSVIEGARHRQDKAHEGEWVHVGIPGFDELLESGIPKGSAVLVAGGPGSGKTIFGLQTLNFAASNGEKCIYMTFEESEERLRNHMRDFGWDAKKLEKSGKLVIKRYDPFEVTRTVEAMLEKAKGELLIDVSPILFPKGFKPDRVVVDSLSAIAAAFVGKEETYRIYIEQMFRLLEQISATSFLITESLEIPVKISSSGVEEFLADGVVVVYNIKRGNIRESAIEVMKLRGAKHQKKIVAMQIESGKGMVVYPEQEVFGGTE